MYIMVETLKLRLLEIEYAKTAKEKEDQPKTHKPVWFAKDQEKLLYHKLNLQVSFKKLKKIVIYAKGLEKQFLSLASARSMLERECAQLEKFLN